MRNRKDGAPTRRAGGEPSIRLGLRLAAVCLGLAAGFSCGGRPESAKPIFVFAVVGDPHVTERSRHQIDDPRYFKALSISQDLLRNCVRDINAYEPPVDFAVVLGDIADHGYLPELLVGKSLLDSLRVPYYPVRGNHDSRFGYWGQVFGDDRMNYAFDVGGFRFLVVDCAVEGSGLGEVQWDDQTREWVEKELAAHARVPTFVLTHANLYEKTWSSAFDQHQVYGLHRGAVPMREILESAGNVVAVISGHVHANRLEVHGGLPYVEVGSPCIAGASIRYFHVYRDQTEMTYRHLSDQGLQRYAEAVARRTPRLEDVDAALSLIDGREEHKVAVLRHPVFPPR